MYARVARWEGVDAETMEAMTKQIQEADGPPEGVPSNGILVLNDKDAGRSLVVGLFETEDDLRKGDETLNSMNPDMPGSGKRASVEMYEVGVERRI